MPRTNPFTVTVYDRNFARQQVLGSAISYSFTPRLGLGTGEVVTLVDDPANQLLGKPGARLVVQYRGEVLMSGFVQQRTGSVLRTGTVAWVIYDDRYLLTYVRAWVRPGQNLTATSLSDSAQQVPPAAGHTAGRADGSGYYAWPASPTVYPAETAIKKVIGDNLARFSSNVAQGRIGIGADQGRGGDARAAGNLPQLRFDSLHDGLADLVTASGLVLKVWQDVDASTLNLDLFTPVTWTQTLGTKSGIIADGTYQLALPALTRLILGGPGEDAGRLYYGAQETAGLEDLYGIAVEGFAEGTGQTLKWPDSLEDAAKVAAYYLQRTDVADSDKAALATYLMQTSRTQLTAGRPTAGVDISLSETVSFHYGGVDGYHVGDSVTVQTDGGPSVTQQITEATLTYSREGFTVTPQLGAITQDATAMLAGAVAAIARTVSRMSTRT